MSGQLPNIFCAVRAICSMWQHLKTDLVHLAYRRLAQTVQHFSSSSESFPLLPDRAKLV